MQQCTYTIHYNASIDKYMYAKCIHISIPYIFLKYSLLFFRIGLTHTLGFQGVRATIIVKCVKQTHKWIENLKLNVSETHFLQENQRNTNNSTCNTGTGTSFCSVLHIMVDSPN